MVHIDREQLQEALFTGSRDGVCSMVGVCPSVCPVGESTVCQMVDYPLVWILFRSHENQAEKGKAGSLPERDNTYCSSVWGHPLSLKTENAVRDDGDPCGVKARRTLCVDYKVPIYDRGYIPRSEGSTMQGTT